MALQSPFGKLYIAVSYRLQAKVPAIKWIDQNFGQLNIVESAEYRPPVLFPCVLIDMVNFQFEELTAGAQRATGNILITIATAPFSNSNFKTPTPQREKALEYYEIEHQVHAALHGWAPAGFERILRRTVDKQEREDSIRERAILFEVSFTDEAAKTPLTVRARPEPVVGSDVEFN